MPSAAHFSVITFIVVFLSAAGGREPRSMVPPNWSDLLGRYNLGSTAGWQTVTSAASRRELQAAVDWRALAASTVDGGGRQYILGSSAGLPAGIQQQQVAAGGQSLLEGTFELVGNNNLDRYLEELGVELLLRQLAVIANPRVTISRYLVVVRRRPNRRR